MTRSITLKRTRMFSIMMGLSTLVGMGCVSAGSRGSAATYEDPGAPGRVSGLGIESNDLIAMTRRMMSDMMSNSALAKARRPPRVIIDAAYFRNESATVINKNMITDLLRVELSKTANGKMIFISREYLDMADQERNLTSAGAAGAGSQGVSPRAADWDYRLAGRIASLDAVQAQTGVRSRYQQFVFEMVERASGVIVWSGTYQMKKTAQDDVLYR